MSDAAHSLRATFEPPHPLTIGVEDELMLLDAETLDLAPRAREVVAALGGDPRFTLELPAAQVEIVLPPLAGATEAATELLRARRDLLAVCEPLGLRVAGAGVHPFAAELGELNQGGRYDRIQAEHGDVARRQLVFALQVHVCVRPADVAMRVYNDLRPWLPLVAALAANGSVYAGADTGLASVRPMISELLPRQGMPPALTWESYAEALDELGDPALWWWELRPHPRHGTLEVRVPDTQATVAEAAAVVAVVHSLVAALVAGDLAPERSDPHLDRVEAYRTGAVGPLAPRLAALLDALEPHAARLGAEAHLATAKAMAGAGGGAERVRAVFKDHGPRASVEHLADRFARD
ncbi:MAG TPA: YbdK family carboxylate-amine ligase [Solirubrobacteraceae bacterium]|jgi:carboxylate-amine ligase